MNRAEIALRYIDHEISEGKVVLYLGFRSGPYIEFHQTSEKVRCELRGQQAKQIITAMIWERRNFLLQEPELEDVLRSLAGRALHSHAGGISNRDLQNIVKSEPVLMTLVDYFYTQNKLRWEGKMQSLWSELSVFAEHHQLLEHQNRWFPRRPNSLSRKLRELSPILSELGFTLAMRRSNGCRVSIEWSLKHASP